jgi:hypothetical protein
LKDIEEKFFAKFPCDEEVQPGQDVNAAGKTEDQV